MAVPDSQPSIDPEEPENQGHPEEDFSEALDKKYASPLDRDPETSDDDDDSGGGDQSEGGDAGSGGKDAAEKGEDKKEAADNQVGRGYTKSKKPDDKKKGGFGSMSGNRKWLLGAGIGGSIVAIIISIIFGYLSIFKLDGIVSNVDQKAFIRYNSASDKRSDKWLRSYFILRLTQLEGNGVDPDSEYFRAHKVDTNNPVRDWYHTMRTSRFEADLAKQGVVIATRPGQDGLQFHVLQVDGKDFAGLDAKDVRKGKIEELLRSGDAGTLNRVDIDFNKPGASKEARAVIKKIVNENTQGANVLKKRQLRKAIANMTGVRDWTFFEKTKDKARNKKIDIRDKIVSKAIPKNIRAGKFVRCLFGIDSSCHYSADPSDPANGAPNEELTGTPEPGHDGVKDPKTGNIIPFGDTATILKQIISKANVVLAAANVVGTLDVLAHLHDAVHNQQLSKMVSVARGTQAMGLYQVFETSRDQVKSGELTGDEMNSMLQVVGSAGSSEGWSKVMDGNGAGNTAQSDSGKVYAASNIDPTDGSNRDKYCSAEHQAWITKKENLVAANKEYHYLCPSKQIGGASNASDIESAYNSSIGPVVDPLVGAYNDARGLPLIGGLLTIVNSVSNWLTSQISGVIGNILSTLGLQDNIDELMKWVIGEVSGFLGAGPILQEDTTHATPAGVYMNWLIQGGAYSAEAGSRFMGANATTSQSKAQAESNVNSYSASQFASQSTFQKYFAITNTNSLLGKVAFSAVENNQSKGALFVSVFHSVPRLFAAAFSLPFHSARAAANNPYAASNFAGIQTYDWPQECYDLDPLDDSPQSGTNITQVLHNVNPNELTWDLVNNSENFYKFVYDKIGNDPNADDTAKKIYNCHLLDTGVRGSLGNIYGYTNDNGLEDSQASSDQTNPTDSGGSGVSPDGFVFPQVTTKASLKAHGWNPDCVNPISSMGPGDRSDLCHHDYLAADIFNATGTKVVAVRPGRIVSAHDSGSIGMTVRLYSDKALGGDGLWYYFAHMLKSSEGGKGPNGGLFVNVGDVVKAGDQLGQVGTDADAEGTPSHTHFDVSPVENGFHRGFDGTAGPLLDPQPALKAAYQALP